jgi:hypothetical protein
MLGPMSDCTDVAVHWETASLAGNPSNDGRVADLGEILQAFVENLKHEIEGSSSFIILI